MPSPLFDFLFLAALFVPVTMYVVGVVLVIASLVLDHWRMMHPQTPAAEAHAH